MKDGILKSWEKTIRIRLDPSGRCCDFPASLMGCAGGVVGGSPRLWLMSEGNAGDVKLSVSANLLPSKRVGQLVEQEVH